MSGSNPGLSGNAHPNIVPYQVFETADEPIVVAVGNDAQFATLCRILNCEGLCHDERFKQNAGRVKHRELLVPLIAAELMEQASGFWLEQFENSGIPAGPVNTIEEIFNDEHVKQRQTVMHQQRDDLGSVPGVRSPIRLQNYPATVSRAAPRLGDSTRSVLKETGLSNEQIERLLEDGVVQSAD